MKQQATINNMPSKKQNTPAQPAAWRWLVRLCQSPSGLIGVLIVGTYVIFAIFGESITPYSYTEQNYSATLQAPSAEYWFGTDQFGRDIFTRVLVGSRNILLLAISATGLGLFLGISVGLSAGYYGGMIDEVLMRLMDIMLSFPAFGALNSEHIGIGLD